jgi:hypothetical protein
MADLKNYKSPEDERIERLEAALLDTTAHLAAAISAYDRYRNKGVTGDPLYKTRIADFNKALNRAKKVLKDNK